MSQQDSVGGVAFAGETFVVKSTLVGTDYAIKNEAGEELLWAKRSYFAEHLRYVYTRDDERRFRFEYVGDAEDEARYALVEVGSETTLATVEPEDEESWYRWRLDAGGETVRIVGEGGWISLLSTRRGRHMTVTRPDGREVGTIDRRTLALHFMFDVEIHGLRGVTKAAVILAVPLLYDAMQEKSSAPWLP